MQEKKSLAKYEDLGKHNNPIRSKVFISNELDVLVRSFIHTFKKSLHIGCIRQFVVIPTNVIKSRLIQMIKDETNIFMGIRFLSLPQAIEHIMKLLRGTSLNFPHHHHMMIFLYSSIKTIIKEMPERFPDLSLYVKDDDEKCLYLAEHLSHTFLSYGLYGQSALTAWKQEDGWQQYLFGKAEAHWDFPHTFLNGVKDLSIDSHFHLFTLPFIPKIYRSLFDHIGATIYHRTPTPHFTSDILPDKALAKIDAQLKSSEIKPSERLIFHKLGKEPNRLFANLSTVNQDVIEWLYDKEISEAFLPPEGNSALRQHQYAIFQLEKTPNTTFENDTSIEIHSTPSKFREIEVIYDRLLHFFSENTSLKTREVQVFAPDIEIYAPAIEFIFDQTDSPFGYSIANISDKSRLSSLNMIRSFFHLAFGRFKPKEIFEIITSPCTKNPQSCNDEEIKTFWTTFEKIHLHWGFDKEMREEILETDNVTEQGTFKDAFDKLISSLSYLSSPIELSQAESLGELIIYLERIATDMRLLKKASQKIGAWIETIFSLMSEYFKEDETTTRFLKEITKLAQLTAITDEDLPYDVILKIIDEITSAKEGQIKNSKRPTIYFSSIGESEITAPKITILLGMDEENFPRCETKRSIDELRGKKGSEHRPTMAQKDKLFFFEALCYTQDHLIISYTHTSDADGKELFPSLIVEDLLSVTNGISIQTHPPLKPKPIPIGETLHINKTAMPTPFDTIEISNLTRLATHPLRFFLQKRCGVFLDRDDADEEREMREFMLSYQKKAEIRQKAYQNNPMELIEHIDTHGLMPTAIFSIAAKVEVENEIKEAKQNLKAFTLAQEDFITIIFDPAIEKPLIRSEQEYLHPPIQVGETLLYGQIELITKHGLFSFDDRSIASIWKSWPKFLIMSLIKEWDFPQTILFAKDGEKIDIPIKDPLASLTTYLRYYENAFQSPSPLMPSHIKTYAKKKTAPKSQGIFKDAYLEAVKPNLDIDWMPFIEEVYETL